LNEVPGSRSPTPDEPRDRQDGKGEGGEEEATFQIGIEALAPGCDEDSEDDGEEEDEAGDLEGASPRANVGPAKEHEDEHTDKLREETMAVLEEGDHVLEPSRRVEGAEAEGPIGENHAGLLRRRRSPPPDEEDGDEDNDAGEVLEGPARGDRSRHLVMGYAADATTGACLK